MKVQFYSLTTVDDALDAVEAGADLLGLVVDAEGRVPEEISPAQARAIIAAVGTRALTVALSMSSDPRRICALAADVRPHAVHLAAAGMDLAALAEVRAGIGAVRIMSAVPVLDASAVAYAQQRAAYSDYLLLDSKAPQDPFTGATGRTHDWSVSRRIVAAVATPCVLAGGLSPENVAEAIAAVRPWGVDSYTHTNVPGDRLRKDRERMRAFVQSAHAAAERLAL